MVDTKREWESKRKEVKKEGQKEKIDSGVIKELSMKIYIYLFPFSKFGDHSHFVT